MSEIKISQAEPKAPILLKLHFSDVTIQIEKTLSGAAAINIGAAQEEIAQRGTEAARYVTNQVIYGNYTSISSSYVGTNSTVIVNDNDIESVVEALRDGGLVEVDARELATILSGETPESGEGPFGEKAKSWIAKNIGKAVDGTWKVGVAVAINLLTEVSLKYYGLK